MTVEFKPGVRYRMPVMFGPAPGPRQKSDGTPWTPTESGTMNAHWMTLIYRTHRAKLEKLLPPGFALRGEPNVAVSLSFFRNLYWLAGRGYGIVNVDIPVVYTGKAETISGSLVLVLWEGRPDAIMTGREELGFPKLFADIPELAIDTKKGVAGGEASWFDHKFFELEINGLTETSGDFKLPGNGGANMWYKYMPRTGPDGKAGKDIAYVTTSQPLPGSAGDESPIKFGEANFKKWIGKGGSVKWNRATFEQLPTTFHVVNGMADLDFVEFVSAEMIQFQMPGVAVSANSLRAVEPAE